MRLHTMPASRTRLLTQAFVFVVACGSEAPAASPAAPPAVPSRAGEPPSVPVPQVRPSDPSAVGWLGPNHVWMMGGGLAFVWEPSSGRVLFVAPLPEPHGFATDPVFMPSGVVRGPWMLRPDTARPMAWERLHFVGDPPQVAPTLDRALTQVTTPRREIVVSARDGTELGRFPVAVVEASFSHDGERVLTCDASRAELHDARTGRWLAAWTGDATTCAWSGGEGPIAVERDRDLVLLDGHSLAPLGEPIPFGRSAASFDGSHGAQRLAIPMWGSREGISVIDLATRREVFHRSMLAPQRVRVAGDIVAYVGYGGGGAFRITDALEGEVLVEEREDMSLELLSSGGELLVPVDGVWSVLGATGAIVARYDAPELLEMERRSTGLELQRGAASFYVDGTLEVRRFGVCPERPTSSVGLRPAPTHLLSTGAGWSIVGDQCIRRDDGTVLWVEGMRPLPRVHGLTAGEVDAFGGGRFVAEEHERLVVRDRAGELVSVLASEADEEPACETGGCLFPLDVSDDGLRVVTTHGPQLRVFDASTGRIVGRATVGRSTSQVMFASSDTVVHVDSDHVASLFRVGTRRLTLIATWRAGPVRHGRPLTITPSGILDDQGSSLELRGLDGELLIERAVPRHSERVEVGDGVVFVKRHEPDEVIVLRFPELREIGVLEGNFLGARTADDVFTCVEEHVSRSTREGDGWRTRALEVPCGPFVALDERHVALLADGRAAVFFIAEDDSHLELLAVADGDVVSLVSVDGSYGSGARVMLRRSELTSEGMIDVAALGTVAEWMAR